jgi:hypothetical protein
MMGKRQRLATIANASLSPPGMGTDFRGCARVTCGPDRRADAVAAKSGVIPALSPQRLSLSGRARSPPAASAISVLGARAVRVNR